MEYVSVGSKAEALDRIGHFGRDGLIMAGGTYVMADIKRGLRSPTAVIHIERAGEFRAIQAGAKPTIGALATHRSIVTNPALKPCGALRAAAATCGGWQTQNAGTMGGNICNASPAADLIPPLLTYGARVNLESRGAARSVPLEAFLLGPGRTTCAADELLVSVEFDPLPERAVDAFVKVRRRHAMDSAILSLALCLTLRGDGETIEDIRIAVGGAAPTPYRAAEAESLLVGRAVSDGAIAAASDAIVRRAAPIDDVRGSAAYRIAVLPRVFAKALRQTAATAAASIH